MSTILNLLLDADRRAACEANDAAMGIPAPPVEMDADFYARADLAMLVFKAADGYNSRSYQRGLEAQQAQLARDGRMPS